MNFEKLCPHCMEERRSMQDTKCSFCGYDFSQVKEVQHQLRPNTILAGKYLVGDVLGEGGFGITYVGYDLNLEMKVAIKEFYPNGYATRESKTTTMLTIYAGKNKEYVDKWKDNFIKEARTLGRCTHLSGIVGVKDFFQENNTAYIVMEYLEGKTLKEYLKGLGGKVPVAQLLPAMKPIMVALEELHKSGVIHRDISPDNIMLLPGGNMKLLDFGAARDYSESGERSLSVMLKPGYAPEEQYRTKGKQGPWTDVYALSGTIYKCITGVTPPESMERLRNDELKKPSELGIKISPGTEAALMKGMSVYAENRYQSVAELAQNLESGETAGGGMVNLPTENVHLPQESVKTNTGENKASGNGFSNLSLGKKIGILAAGFVVIFLLILGAGLRNSSPDKKEETAAVVGQENAVTEEVAENAALAEGEENQEYGSVTLSTEEALQFYRDYVDSISPKVSALSLVYIDEDDIPECLLLMQEGGREALELISCANGEINQLFKLDSNIYSMYLGYKKGENQILLQEYLGDEFFTLWELNEDSSVCNLVYSVQKNQSGADEGQCYVIDQSILDHYNITMQDYQVSRLGDIPYRVHSESSAMGEINAQGIFTTLRPNAADIDQAYSTLLERDADYESENRIHRYELIVANASWEQAYEDCLRRGGYLARINTREEFDVITNQIIADGLSSKIFWIGAKLETEEIYRNNGLYEYQDFSFIDENREPKIDGLTNFSWANYWLPGEPSYYCYDERGNYVEEGYACIFYGSESNRFYLNDMNNNVLSIVKNYSGKIGYICEYEN